MIKSMKKGLLVTELMGAQSTMLMETTVEGPLVLDRKWKILFPVSEITIAGNLNKIFQS